MKNFFKFASWFFLLAILLSGFSTTTALFVTPSLATESEMEESGFKQLLRKYLNKVELIIKYPITEKILGKSPEDIKLPEIPEIVSNAKRVVEFKEKELNLAIPKEDVEKSNYHFVHEIYLVTMKRNPREDEISKWLNSLSQNATREGIYRAVVLGSEYVELENYKDNPSEKQLSFAISYLKKYLNLTIDQKSFENLNIFSIKKYCVEKTLELIDIFLASKQPELLYDWYAVLSGDLAEGFPSFWSGELRKSISKKGHRDWAAKVYYDWLRVETAIKLHHTLNSLH